MKITLEQLKFNHETRLRSLELLLGSNPAYEAFRTYSKVKAEHELILELINAEIARRRLN